MGKSSIVIKIIAVFLAIHGFDSIFDLLNQGVFTRGHLDASDSYRVVIATLVALINVSAAVSLWKLQVVGWYLTLFSCLYSLVQNGRLAVFGFPYAPPGMIIETLLRIIFTIVAVWFLLKDEVLKSFELAEINKIVIVAVNIALSVAVTTGGYAIASY